MCLSSAPVIVEFPEDMYAQEVQREVRLRVEEEGQRRPAAQRVAVALAAIPMAQLGSHVEKNHSKNNKGFNDEYQVTHHLSQLVCE